MVLNVKKFSEFIDGGDLPNDANLVGYGVGGNIRYVDPWSFLRPGATGDRPTPDPAIIGRFRYNTQTTYYEYWDGTDWAVINTANNIFGILASHLPGEGASLIGLQNQTGVTDKTLQDAMNASIVTQTNTGVFTNGFALGSVATGLLFVTTTTGALASRSIAGTASQIDVANGSGSGGNPTMSLSATVNLPGTFTIQSSTVIDEIINDNNFTTATTSSLSTSLSTRIYIQSLQWNANLAAIAGLSSNGFITKTGAATYANRTMTGTTNQIDIVNGTGVLGDPTYSLSSTLNLPGTFTIQSSTAVSGIINDNTMATAAATNMPTALSVKTYIDNKTLTVLTPVGIAGTTQAAAVNTKYYTLNANQTTITLPATAAFGSIVQVVGIGTNGWVLVANSGQSIRLGAIVTSTGGSITSSNQSDTITVSCAIANTLWVAECAISGSMNVI